MYKTLNNISRPRVQQHYCKCWQQYIYIHIYIYVYIYICMYVIYIYIFARGILVSDVVRDVAVRTLEQEHTRVSLIRYN